MTTQEIVSKLWNLCNVLRDDGITYHQYVTELTYILFLKMAKETGAEKQIPEGYRWDVLKSKSGVELKKFYKELLNHLGENCTGRVREIYQGSATNIEEPKNLEKIITTIDGLDWFSAREEGLGNLYEGLLEKNANEKKSGAGQYFTPRVLIDVMTRLMKPQPGERCNDPACGTFGFMISASQYVRENTDDLFQLGSIGLIKAIYKFDPRFNVKFSTYAVPMILGEIKRYLRDDGMVKVSRSLKQIAIKAKTTSEILSKKLGREPSIEELAKELDVEKEDLVMAMESNFSVEYLHGVIHEEEGSPICLIDKISQKGESEEEKVVENILLKEVLGKLEKRERQIIMLRYFEDRTQSEIGELLNISQVQVSRIEKKVLSKLKSYIS